MLVVDRRDDAGAYGLGDNRSMRYSLDPSHLSHGQPEPTVLPVQVLGDEGDRKDKPNTGVFTLVETPGTRVCSELLFQRIWGVR